MWTKIITTLALGLSISISSSLAQNIPIDSKLEALVSRALEQNPEIASATHKANSAGYRVSPAGAWPDPMAMVSLSGPTAGSWVGEPMAMSNVMIGLNQMIPFPGKKGAMKSSARSMAEGQSQMLEMSRQRLASMVRSAYYDLAYWQAARQTVLENIGYIDELEKVARERYKVGMGLQVNVLQAQKTRTRLEDQKLMIEQMISVSQSKLAELVGDSSLEPIKADLPAVTILPEQDHSALLAILEEDNPQLKKSKYEIASRQSMLKKAKLDYFPDINLGFAYGIRWENKMFPMFSEDMVTVSLGVNLPLWAGWKQKNLVSAASADLQQSEYANRDLKNQLSFALDKSLLEYGRNRSRYTLYKESLIPQSQSVLESARSAFEVGKLEFLDVVNAQMEYFNAELELQKTLADALKGLAEIDMLTAVAASPSNNTN